MTSPPAPVEPPGVASPPALIVTPTPGTRLDALAARYALLKPQVDALTKELEEVKAGLKAETVSTCPDGATDMTLTSRHLTSPLRLHRVLGWRLDTKKLKAEAPETYVRFATQTTTWRLDPVS